MYIGEFKNEKEGLGVYFYFRGGFYYGFFKNDKQHDFG